MLLTCLCVMPCVGEVVLLHLTIRQQLIDGSPFLTGYGFMEALSYVHVYVGGILLQPDLVFCRPDTPAAEPRCC